MSAECTAGVDVQRDRLEVEFVFQDGTRLTGSGNDLAEALHDAYRRNGFLPFCEITAKREVLIMPNTAIPKTEFIQGTPIPKRKAHK